MTITWTGTNKNSASWMATTKTGNRTSSGQYYGFGAFTYSGGQSLPGNTTWTAATKH